MDNIKDKVKRWKATAELFLEKDIRVFIKDVDNNIYFADIILVGEDTISIQCFAPDHRSGMKFNLYWLLIERFEEYKEIQNA